MVYTTETWVNYLCSHSAMISGLWDAVNKANVAYGRNLPYSYVFQPTDGGSSKGYSRDMLLIYQQIGSRYRSASAIAGVIASGTADYTSPVRVAPGGINPRNGEPITYTTETLTLDNTDKQLFVLMATSGQIFQLYQNINVARGTFANGGQYGFLVRGMVDYTGTALASRWYPKQDILGLHY